MGQAALVTMGLLALLACRNGEEDSMIVTEVVPVDGGTLVITQAVERTAESRVTALPPPGPEADEPVILDLSIQVDEVTRLDPQRQTDESAADLVQNLFVGLTRLNNATGQIEPALAQGWTIGPDRLIWTFYLRDDIYWVRALRSGQIERVRQVTAEDVVFSVRRACDPATGTPFAFTLYIIAGCQAVNRSANPVAAPLDLVQVRAVDALTVEFQLVEPANHFLALTTLAVLRLVPAELLAELEDDWDSPANVMTSGPFVLSQDSIMGRQTILVRNPFWPLPFAGNIDRVNLYHVDTATAFRLWEEKALDLAPVPAAELSVVRAELSPRYRLVVSQEVFYLAYNFESEVFRHPELRRAFGAAIDRELVVEDVFSGRGVPLRHLTPEGVIGAPPRDEVGTGFSPDYARLQMAAGPYRDCRLMPPIRYMVSTLDVELQQAELIRQMWVDELFCEEEQIVIEQVQFGALLADTLADTKQQRPDVWHLGWASYYPDAENWFAVLDCRGTENRQRRPCGDVDELIRQAAQSAALDERWALYREIERRFFAQDGIEPLTPRYGRARYVMQQLWLEYAPASFGGEQYDAYRVNWLEKELERAQ